MLRTVIFVKIQQQNRSRKMAHSKNGKINKIQHPKKIPFVLAQELQSLERINFNYCYQSQWIIKENSNLLVFFAVKYKKNQVQQTKKKHNTVKAENAYFKEELNFIRTCFPGHSKKRKTICWQNSIYISHLIDLF